jgi:TM2 domain-containing membrane protein YozV
MKCANHATVDSVAFCGQCGKALCADCKRDVGGMIYCETCLAARLQYPSVLPPMINPNAPNPGLALFLGFIPGVGAIYNGQIVKAMVEVLIFASLIGLTDRVPDPFSTFFGLGAAAFYFYMVIDSYQTARRKMLGLPTEEWLGIGDVKMNAPLGAALLIGLGLLFLLDNFGIHIFREIGRFWPVLLILVGVLLLQRRMASKSAPPSESGGSSLSKSQGPRSL